MSELRVLYRLRRTWLGGQVLERRDSEGASWRRAATPDRPFCIVLPKDAERIARAEQRRATRALNAPAKAPKAPKAPKSPPDASSAP